MASSTIKRACHFVRSLVMSSAGYSRMKKISIIDFMNYSRIRRVDLRYELYRTLDNMSDGSIIIHKNPEGVSLRIRDLCDMCSLTWRRNIIILYAVYTDFSLREGEGFKSMKKRYQQTDLDKYVMYSRDDYLMNELNGYLNSSGVNSRIISKDKFKNKNSYKYISNFQVVVFEKGRCHIC